MMFAQQLNRLNLTSGMYRVAGVSRYFTCTGFVQFRTLDYGMQSVANILVKELGFVSCAPTKEVCCKRGRNPFEHCNRAGCPLKFGMDMCGRRW